MLELRASSLTKGDALRELVRETGASAVAMCGDDLGDLPAFDVLDELRAEGLATCAVVAASAEQPALAHRADVLCEGPESRGVAGRARARRRGPAILTPLGVLAQPVRAEDS